MTGSYVQGNERLGSVNGEEVLAHLSDFLLHGARSFASSDWAVYSCDRTATCSAHSFFHQGPGGGGV
jgi:hypothetical protein